MSLRRLIPFAFLLVTAMPGRCWDDATLLPSSEQRETVAFDHLELSSDGEGWGQANNGELMRLANGKVHRIDALSPFGGSRSASLPPGALLPDGGAVVAITGAGDCSLDRYAHDGTLRWRTTHCGYVTAATDGSLWLEDFDSANGSKLVHLDTDGRVIPLADPAIQQQLVNQFDYRRRTFPAASGSLLHVGIVPAADPRLRHAAIVAIDRDGRRLWRWQSVETWAYGGGIARQMHNGDIVLVGIAKHPATPADPVDVQVVRVTATGHVRWANSAVAGAGRSVSDVFGHGDGSLRLLTYPISGGDSRLVHLRDDGSQAWSIPVPVTDSSEAPVQFAETSDGDTLLLGKNIGASNDPQRILRVTSTGQVRLSRGVGGGRRMAINGTLYLLGDIPLGPVARVTDNGDIVATTYSGATIPTAMQVESTATARDGSEFILSVDTTRDRRRSPHFTTSRVSPEGRVVWQHDHVATPEAGALENGVVTANGNRVCTFTRHEDDHGLVTCRNAATGALLWNRNLTGRISGTVGAVLAPDRNTLVVGYGTPGFSLAVELLDTSGRTVRQTFETGVPVRMSTSHAGDLAVAFSDVDHGSTAASVYDSNGQVRYRVDRSASGLKRPATAIAVGERGELALFGRTADAPAGTAVHGAVYFADPVRQRSWFSRLPVAEGATHAKLSLSDDAIYIAQRRRDDFDQWADHPRSDATRLYRLAGVDGNVRWQAASENVDTMGHTMALSADGQRVVSIHGARFRLRVEHYDAHTGIRLAESWQDCIVRECDPVKLANGDDGVSRLVARVLTRDGGGTNAAVFSQRGFDSLPVPTRLDQPGIAGAWWSPYANGEGIAFDWLPASRTLFGAWFTYSTAGGNEPSELRWYTLQANGVAVDSREVTLPILETIGGNFAAGPPVSPRQIGSATLAFHDCSKATLTYAFDAEHNDARSGTISLSRLSPATQSCVLADGSTAPAPGAAPPSNGFDARLSGTWFDGATAGQGLQFTVQPGGVFFAPWFTFDPADTGNDPGRQHWFTLQGNLADARNGTAELVLVQTIGGRFDSVPTYNANAVGSATLRVLGCDRAELDYRFDDAPAGGAFRGLHGTLQLARAGGCAP